MESRRPWREVAANCVENSRNFWKFWKIVEGGDKWCSALKLEGKWCKLMESCQKISNIVHYSGILEKIIGHKKGLAPKVIPLLATAFHHSTADF